MRLKILEKKVTVSSEIHEYARKKLRKLDKYFKEEGEAQVTFGKDGSSNVAEITVYSDNLIYRAKETSDDLYNAIDRGIAAMERQIHKNKTRLTKRLHQNAFVREVPPVINDLHVEEDKNFDVIRTKRFAVKPMTPEEAILQMNLLGHEFFVFKNFESGNEYTVVYRRKGGGYGLIVSE